MQDEQSPSKEREYQRRRTGFVFVFVIFSKLCQFLNFLHCRPVERQSDGRIDSTDLMIY